MTEKIKRSVVGLSDQIFGVVGISGKQFQSVSGTAQFEAALEHSNGGQATAEFGLTVSKKRRLRKLRAVARSKELAAETAVGFELATRLLRLKNLTLQVCARWDRERLLWVDARRKSWRPRRRWPRRTSS